MPCRLAAARHQPVTPDQHRVDDDDQIVVEREAHEVAAPLDARERAPDQHGRERLGDHDAQDGGSPVRAAAMRLPTTAARRPASTWTRSGSSGIGQGVWHSEARKFKLRLMPLPMLIIVIVVGAGCIAFLIKQVRTLQRRKRNIRHWEKGEPLEGVGDSD